MKEADLFRQYSEEAVHSSSHAKSENEKQALMDLACTWAQAALMSERVLGSALFRHRPTWHRRKLTMSFDLFMNDSCVKCHKPLHRAAVEPHPTRRDLAVHKFICPSCGTAKTKTLLRKKGNPLPDELAA